MRTRITGLRSFRRIRVSSANSASAESSTGAAIVFYAYVGFDTVSSMSQETRNAQRVVPWALILSLVICTTLYVLVALMVTGLADYRQLSVSDPVYRALDAAGPALAWAKSLVGAVVVVGLISALLVTLLGQVRIFYAMGRDGLLPPLFAAVHPRSRVPSAGTLITGVGATLVAGAFPLRLLGRADFDRHAAGVRDRLHRRDRAAPTPSGSAAAVPRARLSVGADRWRPGLRCTDGKLAGRYLGAAGRVAAAGLRLVRGLWFPAFAVASIAVHDIAHG